MATRLQARRELPRSPTRTGPATSAVRTSARSLDLLLPRIQCCRRSSFSTIPPQSTAGLWQRQSSRRSWHMPCTITAFRRLPQEPPRHRIPPLAARVASRCLLEPERLRKDPRWAQIRTTGTYPSRLDPAGTPTCADDQADRRPRRARRPGRNLATVEVTAVDLDSRQVRPGSLFCCIPGEHADGHQFAEGQAVAAGAVSLLCERFVDLDVLRYECPQGAVGPGDGHRRFDLQRPSPRRAMTMMGVTGTNGKTTVTQLVKAILAEAGVPTGVIGTLDGARTTPEAPALQSQLAALQAAGTRAVAMEVSSHGLAEHRVDGILFDVAAFTNLSRDHLDHHRTMDEYFETKSRLFSSATARLAVVNVDDPWGSKAR